MKIGIVGYCAGLLDGEGSFGFHQTGLVIQCSLTDLEPLQTLKKCLGGNISGPYKDLKNTHHKISWKWSISRRRDVIKVCKIIRRFMSPRRKNKIDQLIRFNEDHPKLLRDKPIHGTISMYGNQKCRCWRCRKAHVTYMRNWRAKKCV